MKKLYNKFFQFKAYLYLKCYIIDYLSKNFLTISINKKNQEKKNHEINYHYVLFYSHRSLNFKYFCLLFINTLRK